MKALNYLKDMLDFPDPDDESIGVKPFFDSIILLAILFIALLVAVAIYEYVPPVVNIFSFVIMLFLFVAGACRGIPGLIIYFIPFVKAFFPYTVKGVWYMFTHMSDDGSRYAHFDGYSGQRVYWVKKFLTKGGAERFIANSRHLKFMRTERRVLFAWDSDID